MDSIDLTGGTNAVALVGDRVVRRPLVPDAGHRFEKDVWAATAAPRVGVRVPQEVRVDWDERGPNCSHRFVPGRRLPEDLDSWRLIGRLAARIALVPPDESAPASLFTRFGRDIDEAWRRHLAHNLEALVPDDRLLAAGAYEAWHQDAIRERLSWLVPRECPQGLAHGDLRPANVVASPEGPVVLDWECAEFGPVPGRDLVGVRDHELAGRSPVGAADAFVAGWNESSEHRLTADEADAHELLMRIDLVRWAVDRCPGRIDELARRCRDRVDALLRPAPPTR